MTRVRLQCSTHPSLAICLYWYLQIETEECDMVEADNVAMHKGVLDRFFTVTSYKDVLERQHRFIDSLLQLVKVIT